MLFCKIEGLSSAQLWGHLHLPMTSLQKWDIRTTIPLYPFVTKPGWHRPLCRRSANSYFLMNGIRKIFKSYFFSRIDQILNSEFPQKPLFWHFRSRVPSSRVGWSNCQFNIANPGLVAINIGGHNEVSTSSQILHVHNFVKFSFYLK